MSDTITELVKYHFTKDELEQIADEQAQQELAYSEVERTKAATTADFNAQLKALRKRLHELAMKRSSGFEMRDMNCSIYLNQPRNGQKQIIRPDTGEVLRTEAMTELERQQNLFEK